MQRLTITIESGLADQVRAEAKRDDRNVSSVARKALTAYFEQHKAFRAKVVKKREVAK